MTKYTEQLQQLSEHVGENHHTVEELYNIYLELTNSKMKLSTFLERFHKQAEGIFEHSGNMDEKWKAYGVIAEPIVPEEFNQLTNDEIVKLIVSTVKSTLANDKSALENICRDLLPLMVKKEFDERALPAVNRTVKTYIDSLKDLEGELRDSIDSVDDSVTTKFAKGLNQIVEEMTDGQYCVVSKEDADIMDILG